MSAGGEKCGILPNINRMPVIRKASGKYHRKFSLNNKTIFHISFNKNFKISLKKV